MMMKRVAVVVSLLLISLTIINAYKGFTCIRSLKVIQKPSTTSLDTSIVDSIFDSSLQPAAASVAIASVKHEEYLIEQSIISNSNTPIQEINDNNFIDIVNTKNNDSNTLSVVLFTTHWCSPCMSMCDTLIKDVIPKYNNKNVHFYTLNTDYNSATTSKYSVRSIPSVIMFKNGKVTSEIIGNVHESLIGEQIDRHSIDASSVSIPILSPQ